MVVIVSDVLWVTQSARNFNLWLLTKSFGSPRIKEEAFQIGKERCFFVRYVAIHLRDPKFREAHEFRKLVRPNIERRFLIDLFLVLPCHPHGHFHPEHSGALCA